MKNRIGNILVCALWLMAVTLGGCFWFGMRFGFNLFSGNHWYYLGQMQAVGTPITVWFYISMVAMVAIFMIGVYLIFRPKTRHINITPPSQTPASDVVILPPAPPMIEPAPQTNPIPNLRPPRLVLPKNTLRAPTPTPIIQKSSVDNVIIEDIFKNAGYVLKKPPRIAGITPILFAIGTDETLWIGAPATDTDKLITAVDRMTTIFNDTLEDITINVHAFTIGSGKNSDALNFVDTDALRIYMNEHQNRQPDSDEKDDFDAYSEYIDTVAGYFNKL